MALHAITLYVLLVTLLTVTSANVVTFDSKILGKPDPDTDLLLLVGKSTSLGKSSADKALRALDEGHAGLTRTRGLQFSECKGCADFDHLMARYHLEQADLPIVFLFPFKSEDTKAGKFGLRLKGVDQPLPAMTNFIKGFDADELKPWIRSLPEPKEEMQQGPVREVVGTSFEHEVTDVEKHVLMLVYSEHDAASQELQPIFEQLGKDLDTQTTPAAGDADDDIVGFEVVRFNSDANEIPPSVNLVISQAPQIYLFRDDDKGDPDQFPQNRERSRGNIIAWLQEMLPQKYYGLDSFFAKIAKASGAPGNIVQHGNLKRFGAGQHDLRV